MPLAFADIGQEVVVKEIRSDEKARKHFMDLGLMEGSKMMVLQSVRGDLMIRVKDSRIALNRGLAMKIVVEGVC